MDNNFLEHDVANVKISLEEHGLYKLGALRANDVCKVFTYVEFTSSFSPEVWRQAIQNQCEFICHVGCMCLAQK